MLSRITYIFSESVFCVLARKCGNFQRKGLQGFFTLVHWYYMLLDSILEFGTPYQAECGVSKVVYLPCGRHSLLADKRNEASHFCYVDLLAGAPQGRIWKHENP